MTGPSGDGPSVLIIVQNLPVPLDRRVWLECQALTEAGYRVSVICPKGAGDPTRAVIDGVSLYKYRPYPPTRSKFGLVAEDVYSFAMTTRLAMKVFRGNRLDAIQACNPRDIFWPLALVCRLLAGTRFVFDQHDLCPELYLSRFPDGAHLPYNAVRLLEWCTYKAADHVIATNASYRAVATGRGGKAPDQVTVVRSGPDSRRLRPGPPEPALRRGRRHLAAYLGVMGPQDGVDLLLRAVAKIVHERGRRDISFTLMGTGDCFAELVALRDELGLGDFVEFTGRAPDELVFRVLSTADVGLSPDPKNPLNDVSTMNKTMEYMCFGLPVVAFDLRETRVSAGDAAVYVQPNDIGLFANAIAGLLDDEPRRRSMGAAARARVERELDWRYEREKYVAVYDALLGRRAPDSEATGVEAVPSRV